MSRLLRSAAAGSLTVLLCLGMSTGPVLADDRSPADPTATVAPSTTETAPTETVPAQPEPTETKPTETEPTEPGPTSSTAPAPPTTMPATSESSPSATPVAPAAELADLQLRVWFEKPSYELTEEVTAHASVTNAGTATANYVLVRSTGNLMSSWWYPFEYTEVTIAPGQTVEGTLSGHVSNDADAVRLVVTASQRSGEPDANPDDNTVSASVPIVIVRGSFRGAVFGDTNGNRVQDPGEALAGIAVSIYGGRPYTSQTETTGPDGTFLFRDLPVGEYHTYGQVTGWYLPRVDVNVKGPDNPDVLIRAIPEVGKGLAMSLAFSQQSYVVNDKATAVLTLTNTGTVLLSDLVAECALPHLLDPDRADVGQLTPGGGGVTVPAGETRHYPITVPVTERASTIGHIDLGCAVGAPPRSNGPPVWLTAVARVPGGVATRVTGVLMLMTGTSPRPDLSPPVPGVEVYLQDSISGAIVAGDVTDAGGRFTFCNLPVGPYRFGVVGSWFVWSGSDFDVQAGENGSPAHMVYVQPGPHQPDPGGTPSGCGTPPAAAPPTGAPDLAATGTGVTRLALSGLLTLLLGTGLVLLARQGPNGPGSRRT